MTETDRGVWKKVLLSKLVVIERTDRNFHIETNSSISFTKC